MCSTVLYSSLVLLKLRYQNPTANVAFWTSCAAHIDILNLFTFVHISRFNPFGTQSDFLHKHKEGTYFI